MFSRLSNFSKLLGRLSRHDRQILFITNYSIQAQYYRAENNAKHSDIMEIFKLDMEKATIGDGQKQRSDCPYCCNYSCIDMSQGSKIHSIKCHILHYKIDSTETDKAHQLITSKLAIRHHVNPGLKSSILFPFILNTIQEMIDHTSYHTARREIKYADWTSFRCDFWNGFIRNCERQSCTECIRNPNFRMRVIKFVIFHIFVILFLLCKSSSDVGFE